ncbi:ribonuclease H [Brazilian marseillevirus]|uniref:Rnase H n=1 Tax=Brazilian marseillevirus TaxID=1813599 RepID=UPI000780C8C5|nr:Rnase H [Brazilian marseillevirus]AMQ10652.1 ribonuclease H [Brazilian marseillevirus]
MFNKKSFSKQRICQKISQAKAMNVFGDEILKVVQPSFVHIPTCLSEPLVNKTPYFVCICGVYTKRPGNGGCACIITKEEKVCTKLSEFLPNTTNNEADLAAVVKALSWFTGSTNVTVYTNSRYVLMGTGEWLSRWKRDGWKNSSKKTVANVELWKELDSLCQRHCVEFEWIHSYHPLVEDSRKLARSGLDSHLS